MVMEKCIMGRKLEGGGERGGVGRVSFNILFKALLNIITPLSLFV